MAGFWDKMLGKGQSADAPAGDVDAELAGVFAGYPADPPRYPGDPKRLSDEEVDANLAQFLDQRAERLAIVTDFLRGKGVDPAPMLADPADDRDGAAALAAAKAVDAWLDRVLPKRPFSPVAGDETPNPPSQAFRASDRSGADIYYSFLADLGLLEGEAIRLRDPGFEWRINRLRDFSDMGSYRRICLIKPGSADWAPTVLEMDERMLAICHPKMAPRGNNSGHWFGELLNDAIEGGFDPR